MSLLACVMDCIYSLIEFLTKFATIMAAITGARQQMEWSAGISTQFDLSATLRPAAVSCSVLPCCEHCCSS